MQRFSLFFILLLVHAFGYAQTAKELLQKSILAMETMKSARYTLTKTERFANKNISSQVLVKLNVNPHKVYLYSVYPNPGAEVLYVKGYNNDQSLVNTNKFPFVSIKLNPEGSLLRNDQHHTITAMGFTYFKNVVKQNIAKTGEEFYENTSYQGLVEWKGKPYYKLEIDNKGFTYVEYTVQKGETLTTIANKLNVSDYMILALNPKIKDYDEVKAGQKIIVPTTYAKRITLYLDKTNYLPLMQQIYDDKGLFEQYEISGLVFNANIDPAEYTPKYKDYHF